MAGRLQKQAVLKYVPAISAVPGRPAYCMTTQVLTGYKDLPASSGGYTFVSVDTLFGSGSAGVMLPPGATPVYAGTGDGGAQLAGYLVPPAQSGSSGASGAQGGSGRVPVYRSVTTCYPAVVARPGSPSRIDTFANTGWNAGAISIAEIPVGGYIEATVPQDPAGVIIGLSDGSFDHTYGHASHALVIRSTGVTPVEFGEDKDVERAPGSRVRILRRAGSVEMFVDGELIYTSSSAPKGKVYADATLYALSDYVDSPLIGQLHEAQSPVTAVITIQSGLAVIPGGTAQLRIVSEGVALLGGRAMSAGVASIRIQSDATCSVRHSASADAHIAIAAETFGYGYFKPGSSMTHGGIAGVSGVLGMSGAGSDAAVAKALGRFSRPQLAARLGRPEVEVTEATGIFPQPLLSATMLSGGLLGGAGRIVIRGKGSEQGYFGGSAPAATSYSVIAWEPYLPDDQLDGGGMVFAVDALSIDTVVIFALHDGVQITDELDLYVVISLGMHESVAVDSSLTLMAALELMLSERVAISENALTSQREAIQYAVNAATGALSRYEGFGFKQFATAQGVTYAITDTGLYELTGGEDAGGPISASIDFGASDYGTAQAKRVSSLYAGLATDGDIYLRIAGDDGAERIYRAHGGENEARAFTAKGLSARHWRLRLELMEASYADLDNIEIEIAAGQRRLRR